MFGFVSVICFVPSRCSKISLSLSLSLSLSPSRLPQEILFVVKPELIPVMALASFMHDEEVIRISGAHQYSSYTGYGSSFEFTGDYEGTRKSDAPPTIVAMDALQGAAKIQFQSGLVLRDLNKARLAFEGAQQVATGNWYVSHTVWFAFFRFALVASNKILRLLFSLSLSHSHSHSHSLSLSLALSLGLALSVSRSLLLCSGAAAHSAMTTRSSFCNNGSPHRQPASSSCTITRLATSVRDRCFSSPRH